MIADIAGPVFYVDHEGPVGRPRLVYVHGIGGTSRNWDDLAPLMTHYAPAVALDLPGFGLSPAAGRRTTVSANATILRRFLPMVLEPGEQAILVGTSMGALISILAAASIPDLISGVALIDPPLPVAAPLRVHGDVLRSALLGGVPGVGEYLLHRHRATVPAEQRVAEMLRRCCNRPSQVSPAMLAALIADELRLTAEGPRSASCYLWAARSIALMLLLRRRWLWKRMGWLTMPVLLMHAIHDRLVPIAAARAASCRFPHWTYRELDAGHIPHIEAPDRVADLLAPWIDSISEHRMPA